MTAKARIAADSSSMEMEMLVMAAFSHTYFCKNICKTV